MSFRIAPPTLRVRATAALVVAFVFALVALFVLPSHAALADDDADAPAIRWSVTPADASGPDGRTAVEHTLDPGETVDDFIAVRNVSAVDVTFALTAADGYYTRTGRFDILASGKESVGAGTWVAIADSVAVPAGGTVVVPFTITVPDNAEPGDQAAGITASVQSVQSAEDGTSVGVESRYGVRVLTRVTGEITPAASIHALTSDYTLSWNPFRPGTMDVTFEVVNDGNTRLLAKGVVSVGGQQVSFPAADEIQQELLPGDERPIHVVVHDVWPLFLVPTTVDLDAEVLTIDGSSPDFVPVTASVTAVAVPWPQLALLVGIGLIVGAIVWGRVRSSRRLHAMLASAREEGRRSALDDAVDGDASAGSSKTGAQ